MIYNSNNAKKKFDKIDKFNILVILKNTKLKYKEKVIIENLKEKKIFIDVKNDLNEENLERYNKIYSDIEINNKVNINKYISIICVVKDFIRKYDNICDRLYLLKNIFNGLETIVISSGPTYKEIDIKKLKEKEDKYVIMSVKYVTEYLIDNGINIDCYFCSDFFYNIENNLENIIKTLKKTNNCLIFAIHNKLKKNNNNNFFDINFFDNKSHIFTFESIKKFKNFKIIGFENKIISENRLGFNCAHIMLETVIPFINHSNIKNIYTVGWDGPKNNIYKTYFNNNMSVFENLKKKNKKKCFIYNEFVFIEPVKIMFKKENMNVYKCSLNSPIKLEHNNLDILSNN